MDSAGRNTAGIRTGAGFRQRKGSQAAFVQDIAPHAFLFVRTGNQNRSRSQSVGSHGSGHAGTAFAQFFIHHGNRYTVQAQSTVFFRNNYIQQPHISSHFKQFRTGCIFRVHLTCNRGNFLFNKLAHHFLQFELFFRKSKIHCDPPKYGIYIFQIKPF